MNKLVRDILNLDPGNAAALRLRLFSLEQRNRSMEAWQLIYQELQKSPQISRLYFTAMDLALGNFQLAGFMERVLVEFDRNITDAEHRALMAYSLCERTKFNLVAVKMADKLLKDINVSNLPASVNALVYAAKASVAYRLCKLDDAKAFQKKSVEFWKQAGSEQNVRTSQERLNYFNAIGK